MAEMVSDEDLHEYGRENDPHCTVLYGIKPSLSALYETRAAIQRSGLKEIKAVIGDCSLFENDADGFDVVKFEVISEDLHKLNSHLCNKLDYENDYPDYNPHITVAYVKRGMGPKYVERFNRLQGYPLKFSKVIFSGTDGKKTPLELGYPGNENAQHPETHADLTEDLGYGGSVNSGGVQGNGYMAGQLGVYNSPNTRQNPNSFKQYKRYNMMNNNTVVSSGYYDTVFDEDIRKIMAILKELGFKVEWPSNDNGEEEFHLSNPDDVHKPHSVSAPQDNAISSDDVMNDSSGVNLSKEVILKHLKAEFGDELKQKAKEAEGKITYDEIMLGLKDVMSDLQFPDKDYATLRVMKQLIEDPKYYSSLGKYDIHEDCTRDIYGTKFKPNQVNQILKGMK